jgi:integrase/recombinase XerD
VEWRVKFFQCAANLFPTGRSALTEGAKQSVATISLQARIAPVIDRVSVYGLASESEAPLFPTLRHGRLTGRIYLPQANVHMMIQRRARATELRTKISAHSFQATGITTYLQNGGKLEIAQQMAGHESARTTGLYYRRNDEIALDEVERIAF